LRYAEYTPPDPIEQTRSGFSPRSTKSADSDMPIWPGSFEHPDDASAMSHMTNTSEKLRHAGAVRLPPKSSVLSANIASSVETESCDALPPVDLAPKVREISRPPISPPSRVEIPAKIQVEVQHPASDPPNVEGHRPTSPKKMEVIRPVVVAKPPKMQVNSPFIVTESEEDPMKDEPQWLRMLMSFSSQPPSPNPETPKSVDGNKFFDTSRTPSQPIPRSRPRSSLITESKNAVITKLVNIHSQTPRRPPRRKISMEPVKYNSQNSMRPMDSPSPKTQREPLPKRHFAPPTPNSVIEGLRVAMEKVAATSDTSLASPGEMAAMRHAVGLTVTTLPNGPAEVKTEARVSPVSPLIIEGISFLDGRQDQDDDNLGIDQGDFPTKNSVVQRKSWFHTPLSPLQRTMSDFSISDMIDISSTAIEVAPAPGRSCREPTPKVPALLRMFSPRTAKFAANPTPMSPMRNNATPNGLEKKSAFSPPVLQQNKNTLKNSRNGEDVVPTIRRMKDAISPSIPHECKNTPAIALNQKEVASDPAEINDPLSPQFLHSENSPKKKADKPLPLSSPVVARIAQDGGNEVEVEHSTAVAAESRADMREAGPLFIPTKDDESLVTMGNFSLAGHSLLTQHERIEVELNRPLQQKKNPSGKRLFSVFRKKRHDEVKVSVESSSTKTAQLLPKPDDAQKEVQEVQAAQNIAIAPKDAGQDENSNPDATPCLPPTVMASSAVVHTPTIGATLAQQKISRFFVANSPHLTTNACTPKSKLVSLQPVREPLVVETVTSEEDIPVELSVTDIPLGLSETERATRAHKLWLAMSPGAPKDMIPTSPLSERSSPPYYSPDRSPTRKRGVSNFHPKHSSHPSFLRSCYEVMSYVLGKTSDIVGTVPTFIVPSFGMGACGATVPLFPDLEKTKRKQTRFDADETAEADSIEVSKNRSIRVLRGDSDYGLDAFSASDIISVTDEAAESFPKRRKDEGTLTSVVPFVSRGRYRRQRPPRERKGSRRSLSPARVPVRKHSKIKEVETTVSQDRKSQLFSPQESYAFDASTLSSMQSEDGISEAATRDRSKPMRSDQDRMSRGDMLEMFSHRSDAVSQTIWQEIADASLVVERALNRIETVQSNDSNPDRMVQSLLSMRSNDSSNLADLERSLAVLKKHADHLGVRESDLLMAVKEDDVDVESAAGDSVRTMTFAEEFFDALNLFKGSRK
jgi:hypothetical protein